MTSKEVLKVFRNFVAELSTVSKCQDRQVACLICDSKLQQIYSVGVNGGPSGAEKHMQCLCATDSKYSCIHAEANALVKLTSSVRNKIMICSLAPCTQCASMIINELGGFKMVLFLEAWKEDVALQLLSKAGISVGKLNEDGSIKFLYL